ncbi:diguanylate cyclase [Shewanella olleyana]|uniref:sensor domain-containing diguanylate cyclase n=1 Tax=Shewanella olleyana TaxID=135626 RepID=UPI00200DFB68|nr:diguanylate cyclase [Shewanella olleyana]MCL1065991.1 diguanylate cyclase [Shewanella olleyana]
MNTFASQIEALTAQVEQLKRQNEALKQKNIFVQQQLSAALDGTGLCVWEQHIPSGDLTIYNQEWGTLLGYTREELAANIESWKGNLHPEDKDWVIKAFEDHINGKEEVYQAVHRMIHKDGTTSWVSDRGRIVEYSEDGSPLRIMGTHIDITQEKRYQLDLARLAHSDPLTDLLNRKAIKLAFEDLLKDPDFSSGTLLFIDIDDFKLINDRYGHRFGDLALIDISKTLQKYSTAILNNQQVSIARIGGDEFIILTNSADNQVICALAENLVDHFKKQHTIEDKIVSIGLSIGIRNFNRHDHFLKICEQADNAMYAIKQAGKHNYSFWQQPKSISQITG